MLYLQLVVEVVVEAEEVEVALVVEEGLGAAVVVVARAMVVVLHMGLLHLPTAALALVTAMDVRLTCSSVMHQVLEFWPTVMQPSLLQPPDAACFFLHLQLYITARCIHYLAHYGRQHSAIAVS